MHLSKDESLSRYHGNRCVNGAGITYCRITPLQLGDSKQVSIEHSFEEQRNKDGTEAKVVSLMDAVALPENEEDGCNKMEHGSGVVYNE
ncbi:hypothetical protein GGP41_010730 [Bipolaris sorokiniana]|uniref:Uncharacterized protein n=1 Tax=Cochliobolus sativus TaxID=45130 RepID=A0A8H5ZLG5_COCSA|nr:hypothetical protein GGP41_010730 [Bipolaris sorokiniana]